MINVSIPSRGSGLGKSKGHSRKQFDRDVSIPSRGSGLGKTNEEEVFANKDNTWFQSPLGEVV